MARLGIKLTMEKCSVVEGFPPKLVLSSFVSFPTLETQVNQSFQGWDGESTSSRFSLPDRWP